MSAGRVSISAVSAAGWPDMIALLRAIEAERLPDDPEAAVRAEAEVRLSMARFDFTQAAASRMLLATVEAVTAGSGPAAASNADHEGVDRSASVSWAGTRIPAGSGSAAASNADGEGIDRSASVSRAGTRNPAGFALVVRIPKPDARVGFLFVEELYVLGAHRRAGVASALLRACESVAREWGLHGIRLLVRPENDTARMLYQSAGYAESATSFCEKLLG